VPFGEARERVAIPGRPGPELPRAAPGSQERLGAFLEHELMVTLESFDSRWLPT
jgi:hypothetical protein